MRFITMGSEKHPTLLFIPGLSATAGSRKNACREVYAYRISVNLRNTASRVEFWRGSREVYPKKGAALLREHIPAMTERVFPDMGHCQFLHEHPEEYAVRLDRYMR